jgi:hypothetical protein
MNRREVAVWAFAACIVLTILVVVIRRNSSPSQDVEWQSRHKGVMEKKFESLKNDMTKAEVDAILGKPTGISLWGGSKSTCEQYDYVWRGDDGLISIFFAKSPKDEFAPYGPPAMDNRIKDMCWQPSSRQPD